MSNIKTKEIKKLIHKIRGVHVILDKDLAILYECKNGTKSINLAAKRHPNRFPERYMFQLTLEEYNNLKFQIETSSSDNYGGVRKLPYAFTKQGVSMLATIMKTPVAEKISIAIIDAFVSMHHFIKENQFLLDNLINIRNQVDNNTQKLIEHDTEINNLFFKLENKIQNEMIYFDGQIFDAYSKLIDIMSKAKKELIIIDAYADINVLNMISNIKSKVIVITKEKGKLKNYDIEKYNNQYSNLKVIYNNTFHDRFLILDRKIIYHCGASLNYAGLKTFGINKLEEPEITQKLIDKIKTIII